MVAKSVSNPLKLFWYVKDNNSPDSIPFFESTKVTVPSLLFFCVMSLDLYKESTAVSKAFLSISRHSLLACLMILKCCFAERVMLILSPASNKSKIFFCTRPVLAIFQHYTKYLRPQVFGILWNLLTF